MRCRQVKQWIYSCRPHASWPAEVVTHMQGCSACQALRARFAEIDQGMNQLAPERKGSDLRGRILAGIVNLPQTSAPAVSLPASRWRWHRLGLYVAGAAALILVGWFLDHGRDIAPSVKTVEVFRDRTVEVVRDRIVAGNSAADRTLFTSLIKRNVVLVQAAEAAQRLQTLLDMADDCRQHALTLIEKGPRDYLPLTIGMYAKLLRDGVLVQLERAPEDTRPVLAKTVRSRLQQMAEPPAGMSAEVPKALEDQRVALQNAIRQTIAHIDQPEQGAPAPGRAKLQRGEPVHPNMALVLFAIAISNETDEVARAEFCAECVNQLTPAVLVCLADDSDPQQSELGQQFGELIRFGIYTPIAVAKTNDPSPQTSATTERILEQTTQVIEVMEKNLAQARPAERAGLARAIEASRKGREKHPSQGKKTSPAKGKKGKSDLPPGQIKKTSGQPSRDTITLTAIGDSHERQFSLAPRPLVGIRRPAAGVLVSRRNE